MIKMTPDEIVTEITMTLNKNPFFIVEGNQDSNFFSYQDDFKHINIFIAFGCDNVITVINQCEKEKIEKVLGIIDRDYRIPLKDVPETENVVMTDLRDFECMIFSTDILDKILTEKCSKRKLKKTKCTFNDIRNYIIEIGEYLGRIRFYSEYNNMDYKFDSIKFEKIIDLKIFKFEQDKFVNHFIGLSESNYNFSEDVFDKAKYLVESIKYFSNSLFLCSGHDLMKLLGLSLRKKWGNKNKHEASIDNLQEIFRISYTKEYYENTKMFYDINEWLQNM